MNRDFLADTQATASPPSGKGASIATFVATVVIAGVVLFRYLGDPSETRLLMVGIVLPLVGLFSLYNAYFGKRERPMRLRIVDDVLWIPGRVCGARDLVDGFFYNPKKLELHLRVPLVKITAARRVTDPAEVARVMSKPEPFGLGGKTDEQKQREMADRIRTEHVSDPDKIVAITVDRLERWSGSQHWVVQSLVDFTAYASVEEPEALVTALSGTAEQSGQQ